MGAAPVSLDQGPPLPPNLQPAPQASAQSLAGGQAQSSGSAALMQQVVEKLMFVESTLNDIAKMMPIAAPAVAQVIDLMQKGMGSVLAQGASPPPAPGGMQGGGMMQGPQAGQTPGA